jgi:hypothetical protein
MWGNNYVLEMFYLCVDFLFLCCQINHGGQKITKVTQFFFSTNPCGVEKEGIKLQKCGIGKSSQTMSSLTPLHEPQCCKGDN